MTSAAPDRVNRTVLFLLGLLLTVGSALGLAAGLGWLGTVRPTDPVVPAGAAAYVRDHAWVWWAIFALCLLLAWLGLRWLLAQLRTDRVTRVDLTTQARQGLTIVHGGAVADAVSAQAAGVPGVTAATAYLHGASPQRLHVAVDLLDRADLAEVRRTLERDLVRDARTALDEPTLPVDIELRLARAGSERRNLT